MRQILILSLMPLMAAGCDRKEPGVHFDDGKGTRLSVRQTSDADGNTVINTQGDGFSMKLPGLAADLNIPGLKIGADKMDLDGMKLHPGTKMAGMNIDGSDGEGGTVRIRYTDPAAPAVIAEHYKHEATAAGYTVDAAGPTRVSAHKDDAKHSRLDVAIGAEGSGSSGTITLSGT